MKKRKATETTEKLKAQATPADVRYSLSEARLKIWGIEGKTIAQCETLLEELRTQNTVDRSKKRNSKLKTQKSKFKTLNDVFTQRPELKAAFDRGRFLGTLQRYAATATTIAEAEIELKLPAGELDNIFKTDQEAADTWNQARHAKRLEIRQAIISKAVDKLTPGALKQIDLLLQKEVVQPSADFARVRIDDMAAIASVTRMTLHNWVSAEGCPRNMGANPTFNLAAVWKWYSDYVTRKDRTKLVSETPAQSEKARKYKMENDERLGKLLDRSKVVAGLAARNQTIIRIFTKQLAEQKDRFIRDSLERAFEEIRREITATMPELKLSEEQSSELKKFLEGLATDSAERNTEVTEK